MRSSWHWTGQIKVSTCWFQRQGASAFQWKARPNSLISLFITFFSCKPNFPTLSSPSSNQLSSLLYFMDKLHPADTWGLKSIEGLKPIPVMYIETHNSALTVCSFCGIADTIIWRRGSWRGCDGDWRAEPQTLPRSEGSQSGPTLPQHPLRLPVQGVRTAEGPQRECRGLFTVSF